MSKFDIKIGSSNKRSFFDFSHDVNTTSDFGFVQPLMCMEMMPNSSASVAVNSIVRLAPMPCPTYGHVQYQTYHRFVPYSDVYRVFPYIMSNQVYTSSITSYKPSSVPVLTVRHLSLFLLHYAYMSVYSNLGTGNYKLVTDEDILRNINLSFTKSFKGSITESYVPSCPDPFFKSYDTGNTGVGTFEPITVEGSDYVLFDTDFMYCIKLNKYGCNLRKILYGLGYKFDINNDSTVSILPLMCYFKAWYDTFAIQRDSNYNQTNLFKLVDIMCEYGYSNLSSITQTTPYTYLLGWFNDLPKCYLTDDQSFIGAHTVTPSIVNTNTINTINYQGTKESFTNLANKQGIFSNSVNGNDLNYITRIYNRVNKNTVLGSNIRSLMRSLFGSSIDLDESNYIGGSSSEIQIGDVMNMSGVVGESLGEYAGKGIGFDKGETLKFDAKEYGVWITLACIHPYGSYVQGIDYRLYHTSMYDFPQTDFDSLGLQISNKDVVNGESEVSTNSSISNSRTAFGYIPRYMESKIMNNVLNGDMSRRSTRGSYLPYTLDKYITPNDVSYSSYTDNEYEGLKVSEISTPAASDVWRFIGLYPYLQNSDRIFNNSGIRNESFINVNDIDDNFIIHNYFKIEMYQPLLPISESFETYDTDVDDTTHSVEHS